jgi:hypothetical protein
MQKDHMVIGFDSNFPLKEKVAMQEPHKDIFLLKKGVEEEQEDGLNYPVRHGAIDHTANKNKGPSPS